MNDARQLEDLFAELIQLDSDNARQRFLEKIEAEDHSLKTELARLARAHANAGSFLDGGSEQLCETIDSSEREFVGRQIGPFKLLQQIGEGGMGTVFMAEQKQPVKRRVALKIIKAGMDTKHVLARFEAERQTLAMMDHPNIAKVLEAGTTEDGRPYFVMELVKGVAITEYADVHCLSTRERLELFVNVCQAVQHAHQKGIIHRDLKPSNILVTKFDDRPVVKIIDFGVAKATNQELTERTMFTQFGQVVGTLEYMSPEQAQFNQLDIDTRSDIYSLGVLLYELLTGQPPFDRRRLRTAALDEVIRIIREEDPPKPSTRLSTLGQNAKGISEKRRTDPGGLGRAIRGDIDLIVMKALQKERNRRFQTASDFAKEISRFLTDEPITIRPPSPWYLALRSYRRNKTLAISSTVIASTMVIALIVVSWLLMDRHLVISKLRSQLVAQGLVQTLGNEAAGFNETLVMAREAGVSDDWILTLQGAEALHRGDNDTAQQYFVSALERDQKNVAARAMLCIALFHEGKIIQWRQNLDFLDKLKPRPQHEELDKLFLAYARLYSNFDQAAVELESILKKHPSWHLARVLRAIALAESAQDTGDESAVHQALEEIQLPLDLYPDNAFVLMVGLFVHEVAFRLLDEPSADMNETASQIAARLERFKDYDAGMMMVADYYDQTNNRIEALEVWRILLEDSRSFFQSRAMAEFYRDGRDKRILELKPTDPQARIAQAYVLALTPGRREEAMQIYRDELTHAETTYVRHHLLKLLLLMGERDEAEKQCKGWVDQSTPGNLNSDDLHQKLFEFVAGVRTSVEPESSYEQESFQINFIRALLAFSDGNYPKAKQFLEDCQQSRGQSTEHYWARALLTRWPEVSSR